jgi:hypothetical protein
VARANAAMAKNLNLAVQVFFCREKEKMARRWEALKIANAMKDTVSH